MFRTPLVLSLLVLFTLSYLFSKRPDASSSTPFCLQYLRSTSGSSEAPTIASRRSYWGLYDTIAYPNFGVFNPSMMSLPYPWQNSLLVIGRNQLEWATQGDHQVQPRDIVAGILDDTNNTMRNTRWYPKQQMETELHSVQKLDRLISSNEWWFPACQGIPGYWNIQGPEDGRLFWSHLGEPLLVYLSVPTINHYLCRTQYIVDYRAIYPPLEKYLSEKSKSAPIRFPHSVPLIHANQSGFVKNWIPFTDRHGQVYVHSDLIPQTLFKMNLSNSPEKLPTRESPAGDLVLLERIETLHQSPNCLSIALGDVDTTKPFPIEFHQSSPFLEVVLCTYTDVRLGRCNPDDPDNRIYITLVHLVHKGFGEHYERYYERRIITLNSSSPFNYVSVSKPLMFCTFPNPNGGETS